MKRSAAISEIRAFNRQYTNLIGVLDRHILRSPYSLTEVRIMFEISGLRRCTARQLTRVLAVDEGYLSRTIERLVKLRLISRERAPGDGRSWLLSLSPDGKREFRSLNEAAEREIAEITAGLSEDGVAEVVMHMRRIRQLLAPLEDTNAGQS
jgi:DNA-binding MarR family transcriptional regulator